MLSGTWEAALSETPKQAASRLAGSALAKGFKPEALHCYTDEQGAPLYWRIRAKHPTNQSRLATIIDSHGWPKSSVVGSMAASAAWAVVQHADLEYQNKYLPLIRSAAADGEARKSNLALLEDRIELREGRPQVYGTQVDTRNGVDLFPVQDVANLDKRRAEVGLEPICTYLDRFSRISGKVAFAACAKP